MAFKSVILTSYWILGYQDQSSEEMDYKSSGNITQNARNSTGDNYTGKASRTVCFPVNYLLFA